MLASIYNLMALVGFKGLILKGASETLELFQWLRVWREPGLQAVRQGRQAGVALGARLLTAAAANDICAVHKSS